MASPEAVAQARAHLAKRQTPPPLSMPDVGFLGRLFSSFANTPEGKQNILDRFGIEGELREPMGFGRGSFLDKSKEAASDLADFAGDVPASVMSGLGTAAGFAAGGPLLGAAGGASGAAIGDIAGRQAISGLLGSKEEPSFARPAFEALLGGGGSFIPAPALKAANPLQRFAKTPNITENVMEPARYFGLEDVMPAASRTQSPFVAKAQNRIAAGADDAAETFQRETRENFRKGQQDVFEGIANRAGVTSRGGRPSADIYVDAAEGVREARTDLVGEMFEEARQVLGNQNFPVVVDESLAALRRMGGRRNARSLSDFDINKSARSELDRISSDIDKIQTFQQMDDYRKEVGNLLRNNSFMEEMKKAGIDIDFRDLYGALKRDLEASVGEGKLAQEFGGQMRGQLREETGRNALGVPTVRRMDNQGARNVNQMQEGVLGERDLPPFPGRESEVARGRIPGRPPVEDARSSNELLDEMSGRVDRYQSQYDEASSRFEDLINTERKTIIRMMKDPGQAENVYSRLFRPSATVDNIRAFRQHIGAEPTPGGNPISEEGISAWQKMQGQVLQDLREFAESPLENRLPGQTMPLDGARMRQRLESLGGEEILSEVFGPEVATDLYKFADFIRESDPTKRSFSDIPKDVQPQEFGLFVITWLKKAGEWLADKSLKATGFPAPNTVGTRLMTQGLGPGPRGEGILRSIGAASMTPIGRADTGLPASWKQRNAPRR